MVKLLAKVEEILKKYDLNDLIECKLAKNGDYLDCPDLITKYRKFIPRGWYGFAMDDIKTWTYALDEVLALLTKEDPDFEIHQIKTKFGGLRFYVESDVIEDLMEIESAIEDSMYDESLIY